ncbi:MAG: leucine-rich repeat domain-containing protein [Acidobacteriota bacterium]
MSSSKLELEDNGLLGEQLPAEIGQLTNLTVLNLRRNRIAGPIPPQLAQLENLTILDLGRNRFGGPIPAELAQLANLKELHLDRQVTRDRLDGPIPSQLGDNDQPRGPEPAQHLWRWKFTRARWTSLHSDRTGAGCWTNSSI